mgnify:CR=1 FL=1
MDLTSKRVFLSGTFQTFNQDQIRARLKAQGATIARKLDSKADLAVFGQRTRSSTKDKAQSLGIPVLTEGELLPLIGVAPLNERMEALRGIMGQSPSKEAWQALCALLDDWPEKSHLDMGLEYAEAHLEHWPDLLRMLPERWITASGHLCRNVRAQICRVSPDKPNHAGYLIQIGERSDLRRLLAPSTPSNPGPKAPQDTLERTEQALCLVGPDGTLKASTPFASPTENWSREDHFFSVCGRYVWFMGYDSEGIEAVLYLLDSQDLSVLDQKRHSELYDGYYDPCGWGEYQVAMSDNGQVGVYNCAGDSVLGAFIFWQEDAQIHARPTPIIDGDPGEILGFSACGTRYGLLTSIGLLHLYSLPEVQRLENRTPDPQPDARGNEPPVLTYGGRFTKDLLLIPLRGWHSWQNAWGISVHDPLTGACHGFVRATTPSYHHNDWMQIHSDRLCSHAGGTLRYLPPARLTYQPNAPEA